MAEVGDNVIPEGRASGGRKQARRGNEQQGSAELVHFRHEEIRAETYTREFGISPTEAREALVAFSEPGKGRTRNVCAARFTWQCTWVGGEEWELAQFPTLTPHSYGLYIFENV